jgi:predicted DNA-binding protein (MmcQ/YjbR family)
VDLDSLRKKLLEKPGATEETPFGPEALVFKVRSKMFALIAWQESPLSLSLKCDPDEALFLRDLYPAVRPGYHLNKRHWNSVTLDGSLPDAEIWRMIDDSYTLVVRGLPKS